MFKEITTEIISWDLWSLYEMILAHSYELDGAYYYGKIWIAVKWFAENLGGC